MTDIPVTDRKPVGHILTSADPSFGALVWECGLCFALISDVTAHGRWHKYLNQMSM